MFNQGMTLSSQPSTIEVSMLSAKSHSQDAAELERVVVHLFDRTQARLSSYVIAFGLPVHDAEDIVQETFLSLFDHLERGRPRWNLNGWLFRVAHNLALKRRVANRKFERNLVYQDTLTHHPCGRPNAEQQFLFSQTQKRLRAVFEALSEQDQRCLYLRAEGLKYREIADVLGISLGGVSLSLSRSFARLTRAVGSE
jgi:RNA polymerase sigma-70 factor (ECF subfamily)